VTGPLAGIRIIELSGIGPAPFACMMLSGLGADIIRVERIDGYRGGDPSPTEYDTLGRGRRSICIDLKQPRGRDLVLALCGRADALVEAFRPGTTERLGVGPADCSAVNPRLVYGRMTGWGQTAAISSSAGHDLNYIGVAGALAHLGRPDSPPPPPLSLVGDFGAGGMLMALGMTAALLEARSSGRGQVIDASIVDGVASLMAVFTGLAAAGRFDLSRRGANLPDGGAPFYDSYACADGRFVTVAPIEPRFYQQLLERLDLADDPDFAEQWNRDRWPVMRSRLREVFERHGRDHWAETFRGAEACVFPVLGLDEAMSDDGVWLPPNTFVDVGGTRQPGPAPRFSRTPLDDPSPAPAFGAHTEEILRELSVDDGEIDRLHADRVVA
jgi:alpha-methylacyl-CoA racemase